MKARSVVGLILIVIVLRWLACSPEAERGPTKYLTNRVWVNKASSGPRDVVFHLMLGSAAKKRWGLLLNASSFRFMGDRIFYRLDGNQLTMVVPQDDAKAKFKVRTWPCKDAPKPFDLCLELRQGDRSVTLFSELKSRRMPGAEWLTEGGFDDDVAVDFSVDGRAESTPALVRRAGSIGFARPP